MPTPAARVVPDTITVSGPSPARLSSAAVRVKTADPESAPPGMVTSNASPVWSVEKSFASAVAAPSAVSRTDTTVSVSNSLAPERKAAVTFTVVTSPSSTPESCATVELSMSTANPIEVGPESLSESMVMVSASTAKPERSVEPDTVMVSGVTSITSSSAMVRVKVPDADRPPPGMVKSNVLLVLSVEKSDGSALPAVPSPDTVTETVVADSKVLEPDGNSALTSTETAASPSPISS